jgi:hypothetical protein
MDGVVLDGAAFDPSGTRVTFLATFQALDGDWRGCPTQARGGHFSPYQRN